MHSRNRQPIFNVPASVLGVLAVLILVHVTLALLPQQTSTVVTWAMAFVPARSGAEIPPAFAPYALPGDRILAVTSFFTHTLVHANISHLLMNGVWLLAFGSGVAKRIGNLRFLALFAFCGVAGAVVFLAFNYGKIAPVIGASGAVSGLLGAALRFFFSAIREGGIDALRNAPKSVRRMSVVETLTDPQILVVIAVWAGLNVLFGLGSVGLAGNAAIAWEAHLGGFLAGLLAFGYFDIAPKRPSFTVH